MQTLYALFPFEQVEKDAMFVLHDVSFNRIKACSINCDDVKTSGTRIATKVLFSTVVANKIINNLNANIAAFQINADTFKYIQDVFYVLTMTWTYLLDMDIVDKYRDILAKHYDQEQIMVFDTAVKNNNGMLRRIQEVSKCDAKVLEPVRYEFPIGDVPQNSKVVLYGAGVVGQNIYEWNEEKKYCSIIGWYDKNVNEVSGHKLQNNLKNIVEEEYDYIVITVKKVEVFEEIVKNLRGILEESFDERKIVGPIKHPWDV